MKTVQVTVVAGMVVALAVAGAWAQDVPPQGQRRPGMGLPADGAMAEAVATVANNEAVAKAIGLTTDQRGSLKEKLNAEKMRAALSAARLAEAMTAVLTDPAIAKDLGLTDAQVNAVKQAMAPALIKNALTPQEIERLVRSLTIGAMGGAGMRDMQDRMKEFDKDGDGQISEAERQAARDAWRQRGGERGGERGGARGGEREIRD